MCGPIVSGLQIHQSVGGSRLFALALYQLGRGVFYALFGAIAGGLSSAATLRVSGIGWLIVAILLLMATSKLIKMPIKLPAADKLLLGPLKRLPKLPGAVRPLVLGMIMAFLPCMLTFWALNLAASTEDPLKGAITMLLLVAVTSFPLFVSVSIGKWLGTLKIAQAEAWVLLFSAVWCGLMTAASLKWIPHYYYDFEIGENIYTIMFW